MPRIRGTSSDFLNTEEGDDDLEVFDQCPNNYQEHHHFDNLDEASSATPGNNKEVQGQSLLDPCIDQQVTDNISLNDNNEDVASHSLTYSQSPIPPPIIIVDGLRLFSPRQGNTHRASDLLIAVSANAKVNRNKIIEVAVDSMEELTRMALVGEPLWKFDKKRNAEVLNDIEYMREYGHIHATLMEIMRMVEVGEPQSLPNLDSSSESSIESEYKPTLLPKEAGQESLYSEASRDSAYFKMSASSFVELLMDLKQWSSLFSNIVSRAMVLGVLSSSGFQRNYDGTIQVMTAEFHASTPFIPHRESYFARYCKQLNHEMWGVVDVSLENLFPYPSTVFRRRPSGCLIKDMPNGCSKVIWVEHVQVDSNLVPYIFKPVVTSGFVFGARRWIDTVVRQCERFEALITPSTPNANGVFIPQPGRTSLLKLSERMMRSFFADVGGGTLNNWTSLPLSCAEGIKVMAKNSMDDPGKPPGTTLVFATSLGLSAPPKKLFNFLRQGDSRPKWDILSHGLSVNEVAYIHNGRDPLNRVSIMQVNASQNRVHMLYLQESRTDNTGSYVVYAPVEVSAMSMVFNGGNPDYVHILPSGFAILPDTDINQMNGETAGCGSLLTVAFHVVDRASTLDFIPLSSVNTIYHVITDTAMSIKAAVMSNNL
ncbi:homeobox-leucine zipper protein ROC2 isoform X2 [Ziziphus jujuba]|uniref:Homeobox-leucine zipper protein ROC2 isoform X2 n=1 Tax=Ziziphus jujuba TaxID=326968 RepID=A0ABM3I7Y9_ZIZJJ|nr:homeobox-leucine zipper protein ROC2 isoform X2 [Ziziphus jujuba]